MLIRFALENFMALAGRVQLELRPPAGADAAGSSTVALPDGSLGLSRALLVGDNAAGKTAVLKGLGLLRTLVLAGTRSGQPVPLQPNRHLPIEQPTTFELQVLHGGALWTYGLTIGRELVESESLHLSTGTQGPVEVFTRARLSPLIPSTSIKLGPAAAAERERLQLFASATRAEQPFLAEALRRGATVLAPLGVWLRERLQLVRAEAKVVGLAARCAREPAFARFLSELLAAAGTGISEIGTTHARVDPDYFETEQEKQQVVAALTGYADGFVQTDDGEIIAERDGRFVDLYKVQLRLSERGPGGGTAYVPLSELSDGVLRLMHLAPVLYPGAATAGPPSFFVDELDRSLHPRVAREILARFAAATPVPSSAASDLHGPAQLIATTHDAALLTAVAPCEVRVIGRSRGADSPSRIGPPPAGLRGEELAARFIAGTLIPADAIS